MLSDNTIDCPPELIEDSYLASLGQADNVWARLREHASYRTLSHLTDCVFIMLKPDSLVSGASADLLSGMAKAGWQIIHAEATLTAGKPHFEELYQYNLTIRNENNMVCAWWINARLYAMGPSVALLVRVPPKPGLTAHQQVKQQKGPSNPFQGSPGELRWRAGGTNLALNLLHSADDPISTAREFLIFGSEAQLSQALVRAETLAATDSAGVAGALPDDAVREQLFLAGTGRRRLDLPSVLTLIKSQLRATQRDAELLEETRALYERYRELVDSALDISVRWAQFKELCEEERFILDLLPNAHGDRALLRALATPSGYCFATAEAIRTELFRRKIVLDSWDELVLETSLYYSELLP